MDVTKLMTDQGLLAATQLDDTSPSTDNLSNAISGFEISEAASPESITSDTAEAATMEVDTATEAEIMGNSISALLSRCDILLSKSISQAIRDESITVIWNNMEQLRRSVKMIGQVLQSNDDKRISGLKSGYWEDLQRMLWAFCNATGISSEQWKSAKIKTMLEFVINPRFQFPAKYRQIAKTEIELFEARNWDEIRVMDQENTENDVPMEDTKPSKKQRRSQADKTLVMEPAQQAVKLPSASHPIFGSDGIMRGILISQRLTKSYRIDPKFKKKSSKVYGHNNLTLGDWWPFQIAALRDGAHGARMAGIAGSETEGCWSIVISKIYEGVDKDTGDRVLYSSTAKASFTDLRENDGTKALLRSQEIHNPIRVLRAQSGWEGAPSVGIRYDGLYEVIASNTLDRGKDGFCFQFHLVRLPDQDPIDRTTPTRLQSQIFDAVKLGY